ncbi:MAG: hypothetical protein KGZ87_04625 [Bacteroidetes bacterium]|nr:hypothetical protein [Bacteroidota bacterium]
MSYGAGHVIDMINRMKQNRDQRPSKRAKFKENQREPIYTSSQKSTIANFKTVPEKELNKMKTIIRQRAKTESKRELIILGFLFLYGLILTIGLLLWLN